MYSNDIYIKGDNNETSILQNSFINQTLPAFSNVKLQEATIRFNQGSANGAAGNCFNGGDVKRIYSDETTSSFTYHYFGEESEDNCQYPGTDANVIPNDVDQQPQHCVEDHIGIFNIIDGADPNNFVPHILPPTLSPADGCNGCIVLGIDSIIQQMISYGGDNPYTDIDESQGGYSDISEEVLDDWINYGLYVALTTDNYDFAEEILLPLKPWKWQTKLFGVYLFKS